MSRVEPTDQPAERRDSEQPRQSRQGRSVPRREDDPNPGHTPTKAEGEEADVDEALERDERR